MGNLKGKIPLEPLKKCKKKKNMNMKKMKYEKGTEEREQILARKLNCLGPFWLADRAKSIFFSVFGAVSLCFGENWLLAIMAAHGYTL